MVPSIRSTRAGWRAVLGFGFFVVGCGGSDAPQQPSLECKTRGPCPGLPENPEEWVPVPAAACAGPDQCSTEPEGGAIQLSSGELEPSVVDSTRFGPPSAELDGRILGRPWERAPGWLSVERGGVEHRLDAALSRGAALEDGVLRLDGIDDWVSVPSPDAPAPDLIGDIDSGSVAVWFRYDQVANGDRIPETLPLFYFGRGGPETIQSGLLDGLSVYIGHGQVEDPERRQIYYTVSKDHDVVLCFDSGRISLEPDRWYHFAVTVGPDGQHHAYLDGEELELNYTSNRDPYAFFSSIEDRDRMTVGYGMFGITMRWWRFPGDIADLRIYDRVLTPREVSGLVTGSVSD